MGSVGGGMVDAGYGVGPLVNGMQQAAPAPQPSMPAGIPPQPPQPTPTLSSDQKTGVAPVNGKPAQSGMSSAASAQQAMMKRAGVTPLQQQTPEQAGAQRAKMVKPAPVSRVPPQPIQ